MSGNRRSIRPTNVVNIGSHSTGRVSACKRRKQGGAWVPAYVVRLIGSDAVRTVPGHVVRPAV